MSDQIQKQEKKEYQKAIDTFYKDKHLTEDKLEGFMFLDDKMLDGETKEQNMLRDHYKNYFELDESTIKTLRENNPPSPRFKVLTREEYDRKLSCNKKRYRKKMLNYYRQRDAFMQTENGKKYMDTINRLDKEASKKFELQSKTTEELLEENKRFYPDVDDVQDVEEKTKKMDEIYNNYKTDTTFMDVEEQIAKNEMYEYEKMSESKGNILEDRLKKKKSNRTLVSTRHMAENIVQIFVEELLQKKDGFEYDSLEDAKKELKAALESKKDLVIKNSKLGFDSFSLPYGKKLKKEAETKGITKKTKAEVIVLSKKGTQVANSGAVSLGILNDQSRPGELTFGKKTKFRVLKVDFNEDGKSKYLEPELCPANTWKIYLEAIDEEEEKKKK